MSVEPATVSAGRWVVTVTGMVASFSMVLSATIVNVAVPDVMGAFGVGQGLAQFLATAYLATMTASQLLGRWITGWLGRRIAFMTVLVVFAAGGLLCATSPSIDFLILGRVMQGFSAGIVQPLVLTTILGVFPLERRGMATGIYISGLGLALGLGPAVGGLTIDGLGWRYIFLVPLPFVAAALVLGAFFMPDEEHPRMIEAQASTNAYQDGFVLVTCVFVLALVPTWLIGWLDRRRRTG